MFMVFATLEHTQLLLILFAKTAVQFKGSFKYSSMIYMYMKYWSLITVTDWLLADIIIKQNSPTSEVVASFKHTVGLKQNPNNLLYLLIFVLCEGKQSLTF